MILQCEKIYHQTESKDGKPYRTKAGKPFTIVNIKSGEKYYKFMDFFGTAQNWSDGMSLNLEATGLSIVETEYNGRPQYELKKLTKEGQGLAELTQRMTKLEEKVQKMADWIKANLAKS